MSGPVPRPRVVMVVNNGMAHDARVIKSAQTLHRAGADVSVLGAANAGHPRQETTSAGVRYIRLPVLPARAVRPAYIAWALRRRRARLGRARRWRSALPVTGYFSSAFVPELQRLEPDIVHVHDVHLLGAVDEAFRGIARRPRVLYDAHEYVAGLAVSGARTARVVHGWAALEREFISRADRIITVAPDIAGRLERDHHLRDPVAVVYNAPILWSNPTSSRLLRAEAEVGDEETLLVYSGALSVARGVDTIVRSLPLLPGVHLAIVAVPHPHPMAPWLSELAQRLGVIQRVHFVPPVPSHEVPAYLSAADVAVSPIIGDSVSYDLALPNKLFEYVHAGLPVATSDIRAMSEFVLRHDLGTVFHQRDPADCAAAIARAIDERGSRDTATLRAEFSWQGQEPALIGAYSTLVEGLSVSDRPWQPHEAEVSFA
jgi:glycosyltransferase involved in cell wall biosynthesis